MEIITEKDELIYNKYKDYERDIPYSFILLRELHASENDHTRILISLLKYPGEDRKYPLLRNFLKDIVFKYWQNNEKRDNFINKLCNGLKGIPFNQNLIDAQIGTNDACVIVENKVCNAGDRDAQLERYANIVSQKGIKQENIWVMYLTGDGKKTPSPESLTKNLMKKLNIKPADLEEERKEQIEKHSYSALSSEEPIRFVEADYANHILPWLKKVIEQVPYKEKQYLIPGIKQYIAFLQNLYFILPEEKHMTEDLIKQILKITGNEKAKLLTEKNSVIFDYNEHLKELQNIVEKEKENIKNKIIKRLKEDMISYLSKKAKLNAEQIVTHNGYERKYDRYWMWFQLGKEEYNNNIHFEWNWEDKRILKCAEISLVFHIERGEDTKKLKDAIREELKNNFPSGFEGQSDQVLLSVTIDIAEYINAIDAPKQAYKILSDKLDNYETHIQNLIRLTCAEKIKQFLNTK